MQLTIEDAYSTMQPNMEVLLPSAPYMLSFMPPFAS